MTINKLTVPPTQNEVIEKINEVIDGKQDTSNLVTSVSASSTDAQYPSAKCVYDGLDGKQATLVSGTNIKTINNQSLLGSGNIAISGGGGSAIPISYEV